MVTGFKQDMNKILTEKNALTLGKDVEKEFEPKKASIAKFGQHYLIEDSAGDLYIVTLLTYNNQIRKLKLPGVTQYSKLKDLDYLK